MRAVDQSHTSWSGLTCYTELFTKKKLQTLETVAVEIIAMAVTGGFT